MFEISDKNVFCDVILGSEEKTSDLAAHFSRNSGAVCYFYRLEKANKHSGVYLLPTSVKLAPKSKQRTAEYSGLPYWLTWLTLGSLSSLGHPCLTFGSFLAHSADLTELTDLAHSRLTWLTLGSLWFTWLTLGSLLVFPWLILGSSSAHLSHYWLTWLTLSSFLAHMAHSAD